MRMRGHKYHIDRLKAPTNAEDIPKITSSKLPQETDSEVEIASSDIVLRRPTTSLNKDPKTGAPTNMSYPKSVRIRMPSSYIV
jgi:hypothetical protein